MLEVLSMKEISKKIIILLFILCIAGILIDYTNFLTCIGLNMSNINWDFLNIATVIVLFVITYQLLNKKEIKREQNKHDISLLMLQNCYNECSGYIDFLDTEKVEKYIVPKVFGENGNENIIRNLQNAPFENESSFMDLVKDGQISKKQMELYLQVKAKYRQYVNVRITFHDIPAMYNPLQTELQYLLEETIQKN